MYFHCVFFHTILTVAQNTWIGKLTIIAECYGVSLVIFTIFVSSGVCFEHPKTDSTKFICPKELSLSKVFFHQNCKVIVSTLAVFSCWLYSFNTDQPYMYLKCQSTKSCHYWNLCIHVWAHTSILKL